MQYDQITELSQFDKNPKLGHQLSFVFVWMLIGVGCSKLLDHAQIMVRSA